jgi:hydrogenase maturation protease
MNKTLIYGYGNVGRKDDGLGVLLAQQLEDWIATQGIKHVAVETNYQLNIEDAEIISHYDTVFFVDASLETEKDIYLEQVTANDAKIEFSMHAISPAYVLQLCINMFAKHPEVFALHVKGFDWDFVEGLSYDAERSLQKAFNVLTKQMSVVSQ